MKAPLALDQLLAAKSGLPLTPLTVLVLKVVLACLMIRLYLVPMAPSLTKWAMPLGLKVGRVRMLMVVEHQLHHTMAAMQLPLLMMKLPLLLR